VQALPPAPHAVSSVPARQLFVWQHPVHDVVSQRHRPETQCVPAAAHGPVKQGPLQPSLWPQVLPLHVGVHVPVPQRFAPPRRRTSAPSRSLRSRRARRTNR